MDNPAILAVCGEVRSFMLQEKLLQYVAIIEQNSRALYYGRESPTNGHCITTMVPKGGSMVLYHDGNNLYEGFFDDEALPLGEEGAVIQKKIID